MRRPSEAGSIRCGGDGTKRRAASNPQSPIPASNQSQGRLQAPLCFANRSQVSTTVSGFSDTDSMP